jgi:hypothetical protein
MAARKKTKQVVQIRRRPARRNLAQRIGGSDESKLLNLILDPCGAELVHGYAMTTQGVVQRFNRFITPVATTETAFAYVFNPTSQSTVGGFAGVVQKLAVGTGAPTNTSSGGPGETFLETNADNVACLAACVEVLYTGKLVDRKGYIGVCQVPRNVAFDIATNTVVDLPTLLAYCQHVAPVPSHSVELKWAPSIRNFTGQNAVQENSEGQDNCLLVVAVGVNPNDFVVKFTSVNEYVPKFNNGMPAPRATRSIPTGAGERIVSTLDRLGVWWHNLGNAAAAASRMGGAMVYAAGQASRFVRGARQLAGPATALLALTG